MLREFVNNLELRVESLGRLIGDLEEYNQKELQEVKECVDDIIAKQHKDVQRKFEKISKAVEKYADLVDTIPTQDKIAVVSGELDQLKRIAAELNSIEKMLPALKHQQYVAIREKYRGIDLLATCSKVEIAADGKVKATEADGTKLTSARQHHREQMNALFELNKRVISNLSAKLLTLQAK